MFTSPLLLPAGLKQAVETVNDYNPLMKDFPLNDLLSASELDKIRQALMAIFTHLKKIRNTKYPIQRALRLVEAISRDLSSQLLKVLGTRKLMHVAYEEFEKVGVGFFFCLQHKITPTITHKHTHTLATHSIIHFPECPYASLCR